MAKFDATANEHPLVQVKGFPSIKLFKPENPEPVEYEGDRSLKDLVSFLERETGKELNLTDFKTEDM